MKIMVIAQNTFREAIRDKVLYSVVFFAAFVVLAATLFASVSLGSMGKVVKDFGLAAISFFGAVLSMVAGTSLLNKEVKLKTIYNILSKPVSRLEFVIGKYLGLLTTVWFQVILMGLVFIGYVALIEGEVDYNLFQGVIFALLEISIVCALAILFSSFVVTTFLTGLFTLGAFLAGRSLGYLNYFLSVENADSATLRWVVKGLSWILPDLSLLNHNNELVYGIPATISELSIGLIYSLSYSACCLFIAARLFSRREFI